ncbi:MAG: GAF domain-containing protein [Leptolyngbya sp. Prado105]|jgi:methyl-accepting chemotaxis protein PixJ|nr:GAF domain-containing protein [Leptolyngbya sp. Prado105]
MSASRRTEPTLDMSSMFSPEPTLEEFTAFLSETPVEVSSNGADLQIDSPETPEYFNGNGSSRPEAEDAGRDIQQVVTALTGLKSELKRAGLLDKPNVQNLFRQVAEFAATQPKKSNPQGASRELRYQRKQMSAISAQMRQMTDLDALLKVFVKVARETLQVDRAVIYRFGGSEAGSIVAESVQRGWTPALGEAPSLTCFCFDQPEDYVKNQVVVVEDINRVDLMPYQHQLLEQLQVKASLSLPIRIAGQAWGLLVVHQCSRTRLWQEVEINLLHQLCLELTINLQQSDFVSKLTQQDETEKAVFKVIDRIRRSLDLEVVFRTTTQEVRRLLKADRVSIYRFEEDWSGEFVAESSAPGWTSLLQEQIDNPTLKENVSDCSLRTLGKLTDTYLQQTQGGKFSKGATYRAVTDIYQAGFSPCYVEMLERYQARAYVIIPIVQNQKLWGLLAAYQNSAPRQWEEAEISLMIRIGTQLEVAIQQTENLKKVETQAEQLAKSAARERNFIRVIDQVNKSVLERIRQFEAIDTIFGQTTQQIRQFLQADRIAIYRFNPDWGGAFVSESVAPGWVRLVGADIKTAWDDTHLQETQGGRYRNNESFVVNDIYQVGHLPCHIEMLEQFQVKAYIIVPIFSGQKLWGLMGAYQNSAPRQWEESEINLLAQLGTQFGVAIQQADYVSQIQRQAEREKILAKVSDRIRQSIDIVRQSSDISSVFQVTTQDIRQLLKVDRAAIYRFNPDWSGDFIYESVTNGWGKLVGTEIGTNVKDTYLRETQGGRYRNRESLAIDDIYNAGHDPCHVELLEKFEAKAYVLVPVFKVQELWGILAVYQNGSTRHWEEADVVLLNQIAGQLGVALEQVDSVEQLRTQSEQLAQAAQREKLAKEQLQMQVIQLLAAIKPVFSGDLTVRVPVVENEVGTIADAYNNTIQSLRKIVTQVQTTSTKVTSTSKSSSGAITKLTQQAEEQLQEVTRALDQLQAMVSSTQAVAANARQVETALQQANQTVRSGDAAMNRAVDGILAIRETVAETSKKIKRLSESSQKISKVVNLIGSFTTQTQLLALNASIEATRAGEYGRGFTVVADEVRSLARQSADATREIEKLAQEIQSETSAVAAAMDTGIQQVVSGTGLVNETRQQLTEIINATAQISQLVNGITQATLAQTQQSKVVTQSMTDVATLASKNSAQSSQISASFQELLNTAQQLQTSVGQFKVS